MTLHKDHLDKLVYELLKVGLVSKAKLASMLGLSLSDFLVIFKDQIDKATLYEVENG